MSMETDIAFSVIKLAIEGVTYSVKLTGKAISSTANLLTRFVQSRRFDTPRSQELKEFA